MKKIGKKGMEVGGLHIFVMSLVVLGIVLAIGVLILDKLSSASGLTSTASDAINDTRDAITPIGSTWLPIIVIVVVATIILGLIMGSFMGRRK